MMPRDAKLIVIVFLQAISEAQKLSKYAVSSLGFEDVPTAVEYLTKALMLLTQPQNK